MEQLNFFANEFNKSTVFTGIDVASQKDKASSSSVTKAFNNAFLWSGIICVIIIVISGLMFIVGAGNSSTIQKAKNSLTYAIIGLSVIVLASVIVNTVVKAILEGAI